jgi:hypothetical protein
LYLTGYISGANGTFGSINVVGSATGSASFTAQLSTATGTFNWAKTISGPGFATARDMFIDSNNNIWIGGAYLNALSDGNLTISGNATNAFFARYDTSGTLQELRGIGGTGGIIAVNGVGGNQVRALAEYDGRLYIAGEYFDTIGIGGQTITSAGDQDGFFTTY